MYIKKNKNILSKYRIYNVSNDTVYIIYKNNNKITHESRNKPNVSINFVIIRQKF